MFLFMSDKDMHTAVLEGFETPLDYICTPYLIADIGGRLASLSSTLSHM